MTTFALLALAASPAFAVQPATSRARETRKGVEQFISCFVATQRHASLPWWFVPKENGGTVSNLGAKDGRNAYFLAVSDLGARREIRLEQASAEARVDPSTVQAVEQCI
jgi:hypothetical protein